MDKHNPLHQLQVAFGTKRAKKILKEITQFKKKNPGKAYSFIFAEDGSFVPVEKKHEEEGEGGDNVDEN